MIDLKRPLINRIAHQLLTDQGAAVLIEQGDADFDDGDAENGPGTWGYPDYDLYHSEHQLICLDWRGVQSSDVEPEPPEWVFSAPSGVNTEARPH